MTQLPNNLTGLLNNPLLTVGINPNAQMLPPQPMGGFGVPQNPMMGMPQMMPQQQQKPTSFADRLKSLIPALGDYYQGRSIAGGASLDPRSGDANYVNAMGLQNVQNQRRAREALANQLQQQQIANQVSFMNQMTKDQKNFAYRESLPDDQKANFDSFIKSSGLSGVPSAVQKHQYLQNIRKVYGENSQQEKDFMNVIRGSSTVNIGGEVYQIDGFGNIINKIDKTLSPKDQPQNIIEQEQAKVKGKELAELKIQFPKIQQEMNEKVQIIDEILNDPNLGSYLGKNSLKPDLLVRGTATGDFRRKLDMIKGKEFLAQFDKLRGGGQISNTEGEQALRAGTMIDDSLTEKSFREELIRLKTVAQKIAQSKNKQIQSLSGNQSKTSTTNEIITVTDEEL